MNSQTPAGAAGKEQEMDTIGTSAGSEKARDLNMCRKALVAIRFELNASDNVVATDRPDVAPPSAHSWQTNHTFEIALVEALDSALLAIAKTSGECGGRVLSLIANRLRKRGLHE